MLTVLVSQPRRPAAKLRSQIPQVQSAKPDERQPAWRPEAERAPRRDVEHGPSEPRNARAPEDRKSRGAGGVAAREPVGEFGHQRITDQAVLGMRRREAPRRKPALGQPSQQLEFLLVAAKGRLGGFRRTA